MKHLSSIQTKTFLLIFTFMALPIIVVTYLSNQFSIQSLLEQKRFNDLQTIQCMQESTDTLLDSIESFSALIASDASVIQFLKDSYALASNPSTPPKKFCRNR